MLQYDSLVLQPTQVKCAPPKPVQLGSLRSETDGKDSGVQLVPVGGCGWGRPKDDQDRGRALQPGWAATIPGKHGIGSSLLRAKSEHSSSRLGQTTEQPEKPAQAKPTWNLADVSSSSWQRTQQTFGLEREFPELGSTPPTAASWGCNTATPQCRWPEGPVSRPGLAHARSSSAHPVPRFSMGPEQMKISFEHREQQHAMRERALKRQAEKEAEEAEQQREQFARAQEKLMLLEQRAKERRMKEKQEEEERRRRELKLRRQESPHLRGWPVDHAASNSRGVHQGGGPASPHSRGWFIGNTRSCPALTEPPAETPPPPTKISILQHEHRTAANVACAGDRGNHDEEHRQDWHEAHQGTSCAGAKAASAAVEPPKLSHQPSHLDHRDSGQSNSVGGSSSPGWDRKLVQETSGSDEKSGADYYHQHRHHDNSNNHRREKQRHRRQMLPEAAQDATVAEQPTGCSWSVASYSAQQQQAWSSPMQTWKNGGHLDNSAWQQDGWEERTIAEDEQEAHQRWCHGSRGVKWQQHRAEPDVQQHWEWTGFDWTQERQGQRRTCYGEQGAPDHHNSKIPQKRHEHEQCNGSTWHSKAWQDFRYNHGTQAAEPHSSVGGPVEDAATAAAAAAQAAASRSQIRVAAREARATLSAGVPRGRHNVGETVRSREELHAMDNHSRRRLRAFSDDEATEGHSHSCLQTFSENEALPPSRDLVGVAPTAEENCSRRRLRAFSDDETPVNPVRRGLRAFSGACSSDDEAVTTGPTCLSLRAFHVGASSSLRMAEGHERRQKDVSEDLTREGVRATACCSRHGLRAFSGGSSSSSGGEEQPRNIFAAVNRSTAKLRAWKSGSRTPPLLSGSRPPPLVSGSRAAAVSPSCRSNTATAREGHDFAAKLFRSVIHPKAAVAVGPQRHQMFNCGGIPEIPKSRAQATLEDVVCTPDSFSAADGKAAAPSSGQRQPPREQEDSATCHIVEDSCNLFVGISNASAEANGSGSTHKAAEGSNAGGMQSYYGRRDAATDGGIAISWLASVSRRTPQFSQPQTQHPLKQEQQETPFTQQLEEAAEAAQDALNVLDPCGEGGE